MNPDTYEQLRQTLAPERIEAYGNAEDDPKLIFARYLLNMALCESLYSPLQFAEIALRNRIHKQLCSHFGSSDWYKTTNTLTPWQQRKIEEAIESLKSRAKPVTAGRVVAELTFGFWTGFFNKAQAKNAISQKLVAEVFPNLPRRQRTLKAINRRWIHIRDLRNRIFHHERILHWSDLDQQHADLIEAIHWINPELAELSRTLDRYKSIREAGLLPWIEKLEI
ncbi:Abi family protein [Coraliomargarita akajimensis]|uniref:Abi family protein n=1 Tax=Coraliomargarita akajimensis (strain DSM 45221 / IAM 15411 / JCM 23193 / KCTC 12865 / 04OKA010-24) TaxID=583355 RepID=D5EL73_CORAD|nr:Abi family protein [Coraliomargarita akajimensis]ADE53175.1 protein of unknown function DUF1526 [Coraliomargarita akajimensis DSM 45221]